MATINLYASKKEKIHIKKDKDKSETTEELYMRIQIHLEPFYNNKKNLVLIKIDPKKSKRRVCILEKIKTYLNS